MSINDYVEKHCKGKNKPKTSKEKRKWLKSKGIKLVKHPKSGLDVVPVADKTLMLSGTRMEASRIREQEHETKAGAKEDFEKTRATYKVESNKKAPFCRAIVVAYACCMAHSHPMLRLRQMQPMIRAVDPEVALTPTQHRPLLARWGSMFRGLMMEIAALRDDAVNSKLQPSLELN